VRHPSASGFVGHKHDGSFSFGQLARGAPVCAQRVGRWLLARDTIRFVAELSEILDQRLEGSGIVNGDQAPRTCIDSGLLASVVRSSAARRPVGRPPTLLPTSH
jgi:hypothetical protein